MTGAFLIVCAVLGQALEADPFELVGQLGAPRFAVREKAAGDLERLGRASLPALRSAREAKDPEVRNRASVLVGKIESSLLTQASLVRLDFDDAPLPTVIRSLVEQTGVKLTLVPENSPTWATRRVTLHDKAPVPFWKAIDRVCDAAHIQYNDGAHFPGGREPTFPLFDGAAHSTMPIYDSGPFRVGVVGVHFQRDFSFVGAAQSNRSAPGRGVSNKLVPTLNEQFFVQFQVKAEPRLSVAQGGTLRITEAIDEHGNPLLIPPAPVTGASQRVSGYYGFAPGPVVQLQGAMNHPKQAGSTIKKLKGVIPLAVSTRKPGPLTFPIAGASGRTFQNEDVALTFHDYKPAENNRPGTLEVSIRSVAGMASSAGFRSPELGVRPDVHQEQIEVVDSRGRLVPWYQSNFDVEAGRLTMMFPSQEPGVKAVEMRYFALTRALTEVPFEFTDLPLP